MDKFAVLLIIMVACSTLGDAKSVSERIEQDRQRREKLLESREEKFHAELKLQLDKKAATLRTHNKPSYKATNQDDVQALTALYKSTNGDKWANNTGWLKGDPCQYPFWHGIYCRDGRVLQISLVNNQMTGSLPAELAKACELQVLRFYTNFLTGKIPPEIFGMKSLQIFDVNFNQLSGGLPDITMANLTDMIVYSNMLTGPCPQVDAPMLQTFEISSNMFVGPLPEGISESPNLEQLVVSRNTLTGTLPSSYGSLSKLVRLWTFYNNFQQPSLPDSWQGMRSMQEIQADGLYGPMPNWFNNWPDLQIFIVINGQLTGEFPTSLCDHPQLQSLRIFNNSMSGQVPDCICDFRSLTDIEVSDNQFIGPIPDCIGDITTLELLFFSRNNFSGKFPSTVGYLVNLETLDVSSNQMTGMIPNSVNNLNQEIAEFAVCYNKFSVIETGLVDFFNRIKNYGCAFYANPWSCPVSSEVPKVCGAECSQCNSADKHSYCNSCVKGNGCGWCADGPNCLEGEKGGPDSPYYCSQWTFGSGSC